MCASTSSRRPISTFPIHTTLMGKLTSSGLKTVGDLSLFQPSDLTTVANLSEKEAVQVWDTIFKDSTTRKKDIIHGRSTFDILRERQDEGCIVTFSRNLDSILDGGIHLGRITEVCGVPGVGKTQLCMQLAADVHIPECLGGQAGEAVYIDTEGSMIAERLHDMASAVVQHCTQIVGRSNGQGDNEQLTVERILSGIHCFRCHDHHELIATIHLMSRFLSQNSKVKLVILDSIAAPFRSQDDLSLRTRLLANMSQSLLQLACHHKVAVVLTNQMTTRIQTNQSNLIPALGESWGHCCAMRLLLHWKQDVRWASLYKSPQQYSTCPFTVISDGIRDTIPERSSQTRTKDSMIPSQETFEREMEEDPKETESTNVSLHASHPPIKRQRKS